MWAAFKALSIGTKIGIAIGVLSLLLAAVGSSYVIGYNKGVNIAAVQIEKFKTSVERINANLAKVQTKTDVKIVTEYKDRIQYVDRVTTRTRTIVERSVPEQYKLSNGWIYAYNESVAGNEPDATKAADANASNVSDRSALLTISKNNGICISNEAQLTSLQNWIRETNKNKEEVTK
jgi:hypothetical protein